MLRVLKYKIWMCNILLIYRISLIPFLKAVMFRKMYFGSQKLISNIFLSCNCLFVLILTSCTTILFNFFFFISNYKSYYTTQNLFLTVCIFHTTLNGNAFWKAKERSISCFEFLMNLSYGVIPPFKWPCLHY